MATQQVRTINNCAIEIGLSTRGISDNQLRKAVETISEALGMAYKEIESLKLQLSQQQQTKAD